MALRPQTAYSAGELDPALWERTDLAKYRDGLMTARNVVVHKTGRIISRQGRKFFAQTKFPNQTCLLYSPQNSGYLIEFGNLYVRVYSMSQTLTGVASGTMIGDYAHTITLAQLPQVKFATSGTDIFIFCGGQQLLKLNPLVGGGFYPQTQVFYRPPAPVSMVITTQGSGYTVDYAVTLIAKSQESPILEKTNSCKMPVQIAENNILVVDVGFPADNTTTTGINIYRRPTNGGSYGYIGSSNAAYVNSSNQLTFSFTDIGGQADYTHAPPSYIPARGGVFSTTIDPTLLLPQAGTIFQQRLLIANSYTRDQLIASRIGILVDFTQDFPLNDASALALKCGTSGNPAIIDMIESDGLIVFTTVGVFLFTGAMGPENLALTKKGNWTIDPLVPPLAVPGGVLFVDQGTNSVRVLTYSTEAGGYLGEELSIFSNHLFQSKQVKSWAFQQGDLPIIWITMQDGTFLSFTYVAEQEMRAWTRHDSSLPVEYCCGTGMNQVTAFLVNNNGVRSIELTTPRYASAAMSVADPNFPIGQSCAAMDSITTFSNTANQYLASGDAFTVKPIYSLPDNPLVPDWSNTLMISVTNPVAFQTISFANSTLRYFDQDFSATDLKVLSTAPNGLSILVQPSNTFPSNYAANPFFYFTANSFSGLSYMEGENPSVIVDGYVFASPNNDEQKYPVLTVTNGVLTLPNGMTGAIVHVGRAVTFDTQTLDVETVEQRPILVESKVVDKLYMKTLNTSGLYVGNNFPAGTSVAGMQNSDVLTIQPGDQVTQIIGNAYQKPTSKRVEITLPGDWASNGRVCVRQVDPLHFEILSFITDIEDLRR